MMSNEMGHTREYLIATAAVLLDGLREQAQLLGNDNEAALAGLAAEELRSLIRREVMYCRESNVGVALRRIQDTSTERSLGGQSHKAATLADADAICESLRQGLLADLAELEFISITRRGIEITALGQLVINNAV